MINNVEIDVINLYNRTANQYDELSKKGFWYSPQILFGLHYPYLAEGQKLLDLGIGTGQSSELYKRLGLEITGIDGSKRMLGQCREKDITDKLLEFNLNELNDSNLPFGENSFYHVISNGVFYFIEDLELIFKEIKRVLNKEGIFGFTTEYSEDDSVNKRTITIHEAYGSTEIKQEMSINIFSHGNKYLERLEKELNFQPLIRPVKFLAYYSPSEKKDICFGAHLLKAQ